MPNLFQQKTPTISNPGNQANSNPSTLIPAQIKNHKANLDSNMLLKALTEPNPNKDHSQIGTRMKIQGTRIASQPVLSKSNTTMRTNCMTSWSRVRNKSTRLQSQRTHEGASRQGGGRHLIPSPCSTSCASSPRLPEGDGSIGESPPSPLGLAGDAARRSGVVCRWVPSPLADASLQWLGLGVGREAAKASAHRLRLLPAPRGGIPRRRGRRPPPSAWCLAPS